MELVDRDKITPGLLVMDEDGNTGKVLLVQIYTTCMYYSMAKV